MQFFWQTMDYWQGLGSANAFNITEEIEYCAELYIKAKSVSEPVILPEEEMKLMLEKFKTYGQVKK